MGSEMCIRDRLHRPRANDARDGANEADWILLDGEKRVVHLVQHGLLVLNELDGRLRNSMSLLLLSDENRVYLTQLTDY